MIEEDSDARPAKDVSSLSLDWFAEILDLLPVGACLYDSQERIILCNKRHRDFYAPISDMLGPGRVAEEIFQAIAHKGALSITPDHAESWVKDRMTSFREPGGGGFDLMLCDQRWIQVDLRPTGGGGVMEISTEITEIKEKEDTLRIRVAELQDSQDRMELQGRRLVELAEVLAAARDEAERANRTKSEFLANMSHELRSPLNAIIGFSEIMKGELFGGLGRPEYSEYTTDIYNSGTHLLEVINDILDLSKIEAGRLDLVEGTVDVAELIEGCKRFVISRAQQEGISLQTDIAPGLPFLLADERKLKQILINLLSNAVKFTPEGGIVTAKAALDEDGTFVIIVSDTGIGLKEDDIPTALAPFGQVDSSFSRQYEGTGLGLSLTKALVEIHEGELLIESEEKKGTDVIIRLPGSRVVAAPPEDRESLSPDGENPDGENPDVS